MSEISPTVPKASSNARPAPAALRIKKGQKVMSAGRAARVLAIVSPAQIWVSFLGTQEQDWVSAESMTPFVEHDPTSAPKSLVPIEDDFEYERASEWVSKFTPYNKCAALLPLAKTEIAKAMGTSRRTVERHFELYQLDPSPRGQFPLKSGPEKGTSYVSPAVFAIIDKAIKERYLTEERGSIQSVVALARPRCNAAGLPLPCYNTVLARIKTLDRWKAARIRHGRVRGDAMAGPAGQGIKGLRVLDFVQMDHAIVDVIVVDPQTREEIGRPWITLAIDVSTRCVLGFYLSFYAPSQTSVALALEQCCCPKDAWLKEIGFEGEWIPFGLMKVIGWDNAKCFKNTHLIAACKQATIEPFFRRVRTPEHGAHIERLIGTYMGKIHVLKGTTFSNTKDRGDYKSGEKAVMTLDELILWTAHQINGVYHNSQHSALPGKRTPLEEWNAQWKDHGDLRLPPIPADRRKFKISMLPRVLRTVSREGLNRFGIKYWDEALIPFIGDKKKYYVSHDPRNISRVFLAYQEDFLDIPWRDRSRRPIALFEWERAKRELRKQHNAPVSEATAFVHVEASYAIEKQAEKTTRKQRRERQMRPADDSLEQQPALIDYSAPAILLSNPLEVHLEQPC
jgi:putative transposase